VPPTKLSRSSFEAETKPHPVDLRGSSICDIHDAVQQIAVAIAGIVFTNNRATAGTARMQFDKTTKIQCEIIPISYLIYKTRELISNDKLTYFKGQGANICATDPYTAYQNAISERSSALIEDGMRAMIISAPSEIVAFNTITVTMKRCYFINFLSKISRPAAAAKRIWYSESGPALRRPLLLLILAGILEKVDDATSRP
jgi:hypothetical protein